MITKKTPAHGRIYTVTSETGCTVTDTATGKLLQTCPPGVQTSFAAVGPAVIISDDSALFAGPFDLAPGGLPANGGSQPASPAVTELQPAAPATLADARVYHITAGGDYRALTAAPNATAQIWVDYAGGDLIFPDPWAWSDSDTYQLPAGESGAVGDFTPGETYLITVHRYAYGAKDFTIAHRALTIQPATA